MKTINNLSSTENVSAGDLLALWSANNGDTRKISLTNFVNSIRDDLKENISYVDTYDELKALDVTKYEVVLVLGDSTINDGEAGIFYYDPTSTTTDDDRNVLQSTFTSSGRWLRLTTDIDFGNLSSGNVLQLRRGTTAENNAFTGAAGEVVVDATTNRLRVHDGSTVGGFTVGGHTSGGYINVLDYGVSGDGVTDDTTGIQEALDYANSIQGSLIIPNGTYLISSELGITTKGIHIVGESKTILKAKEGFESNNKLLNILASSDAVTDPRYVRISNINFDGTNIPNSGAGQANDIIYVTGAGNIDKLTVEDCSFTTGDYFETAGGDSHIFSAGLNNTTIKGCTFKGAVDAALYISGDQTETYGSNLLVEDCTFRKCNVCVINKRTFRKSVVTNNFIDDCNIGITQGEGDASQLTGKYNVISNNVILRTGRSIECRIFNGNVISGNLIRDIGYTDNVGTEPSSAIGILISGSSNNVIIGNAIKDLNESIVTSPTSSAYTAIKLLRRTYEGVDYDSNYNNITGNSCKSVGAFVLSESYHQKNLFSNNTIELAQTYVSLNADNIVVGTDPSSGLDYLFTDGVSEKILAMRNNGNVGVGTIPQRKFHIANGYADGVNPAAGITGTDFLMESNGDSVQNFKVPDGSFAATHIYGNVTTPNAAQFQWSGEDNTFDFVGQEDVKMRGYGLSLRPSITIPATPSSFASTSEVDLVSYNYTVKNYVAKLFVKMHFKLEMATHDKVRFFIFIGSEKFGIGHFSDSSSDVSSINFNITLPAVSSNTHNDGDVVNIKVTGKTDLGNVVNISTDKILEVWEVD